MKLLLSLILIFITISSAQESVFDTFYLSEKPEIQESIEAKLIYQSYENFPKKIYTNQVFALTVKTIPTKIDYERIETSLEGGENITILTTAPKRKREKHAIYDTFYIQALSTKITTPTIKSSLFYEDKIEAVEYYFSGKKTETIALNRGRNYSGINATEFSIKNYKTTSYDDKNNIVLFSAESQMANLSQFYLEFATNQGIESIFQEWPKNRMNYFVILPNHMRNLSFSYFNINNNKFEKVVIPIIVNDDRVSTQTDLAPTQNQHIKLKLLLVAISSIALLALFLAYGNLIYMLLIAFPLIYGFTLIAPQKSVCVEANSNVYLLPMERATIFKKTEGNTFFDDIGEARNYTKVRLENNQIGWIKHENRCKN